MKTINISTDFSPTPGARYITDGPFSGQEFREKFLEPLFVDDNDESNIQIILDGAEGFATSFLDEAFGALARKYGVGRCLKRLKFISNDVPFYIEEIYNYINRKI